MPRVNVVNKVQWEGISLCDIFGKTSHFFGGVEASTVVRQWHVSKTGRPGSLIPKVLMWWSHTAMNLSIPRTCYFLDAQFRDMARLAISAYIG